MQWHNFIYGWQKNTDEANKFLAKKSKYMPDLLIYMN